MSMKRLIQGFLSGAAKLTDWTSIFLLAFVAVQLITVAILRYVFFTNIRWFEQSSSILFLYLVFIPAGLLSRSNQHLNVEVLSEYLQKRENKKTALDLTTSSAVDRGPILCAGPVSVLGIHGSFDRGQCYLRL